MSRAISQRLLVCQEALAPVAAAIVRLGWAAVSGTFGNNLVQFDPELERCHKIADHHHCLSRSH